MLAALLATLIQEPLVVKLDIGQKAVDMEFLKANSMGYMPSGQNLTEEKPRGVLKEPGYAAKPKYGAFAIGNGPNRVTFFAVDEAQGNPGKVYIDLNQNGDLTDDGDGAWDTAKESNGVMNYTATRTLRASWGTPAKEDESGQYTLMFYKQHGTSRIGWTKLSARVGEAKIGAKTYKVILAENGSDGLFTVAKRGDRTRKPVQLLIDLDGDGLFRGFEETVGGKKFFRRESFTLEQPFQIGEQWWEAFPSLSGAELALAPSAAPGEPAKAPQPVETRKLLEAGTTAPDFTAIDVKGAPLKLSDFKGKVVILDFWATWCGPCMVSMPGLEKIYGQVKSQNVVVLSVNVFDEKAPYEAWIKANAGSKYSFTFAFDPAERDLAKSIAAKLYGVSGIPTMFVIAPDGKIASVIVGSGNEKTLVETLKKLGATAKID